MISLIIGSILLIGGLLAGAIGVLGVFRFKFVMNRMHAAAIVDALSLFLIIVGLIIIAWDKSFIFKLALVIVFQWIGSPIASHMVMRLENETDNKASKHYQKERSK